MNEIGRIGEAAMVNQNGHLHFKLSEEGNSGKYECRCSYPRPTDTSELPRIIELQIKADGRTIYIKIIQITDQNDLLLPHHNDNEKITFEQSFYQLMYSGGHKHIIEYPIFREILSLPLEEIK